VEAAKAALWRDAAPVTPAYAKAAAEELKAASYAMLSSWQAAAQQLALPSDLVPGMFAPAVVEAYPAAARVVDFSVAQQRTTHVMEVRFVRTMLSSCSTMVLRSSCMCERSQRVV
jgi:hypothetical protein